MEGSTTSPSGRTGQAAGKRETSKTCRLCGLEKAQSEFYYRTDSRKFRTECKLCIRDLQRVRVLGVCRAEVDVMLIQQGGRCAVCDCRLNTARHKKLHVDHDHSTGRVRGLLCTCCNTGIGLLKESPIRMQNAVEYLRAPSYDDMVSSLRRRRAASPEAGGE